MEDFIFVPEVGMVTPDSYLHGLGDLSMIGSSGVIEVVGRDYFVLRVTNTQETIFVPETSYWVINEEDFTI